MSQALYRKYRSKTLDEVVGQEHITTTLKNALRGGKISHAYLFSGPRGVGKTSVARILAHEVSQLPYTGSGEHLDIIEIDAASNRRIDEIRDLRERVHVAPVEARYKVYIIDEVHMLTREAFNALLKTLEEPPAHVIFILATTEAHKLPATIISRTQRFTFRPVETPDAIKHLRYIASNEKIAVDDEALELMAEHSGGSFRDSINLLDQAMSGGGKVTPEVVLALLGRAPANIVSQLLQVVSSTSAQQVIDMLDELQDQGYQPTSVAQQLSELVRNNLLRAQLEIPTVEALTLLKQLLEVSAARDPKAALELTLLELHFKLNPSGSAKQVAAPQALPNKQAKPEPSQDEKASPEEALPKQRSSTAATVKDTRPLAMLPGIEMWWPEVLVSVKKQHNTLYTILKMAKPKVEDDVLTLGFDFAFHQRRIAEAKHLARVSGIIKELTGVDLVVKAVLQADPAQAAQPKSSTTHPPLETITTIFGGAELLES